MIVLSRFITTSCPIKCTASFSINLSVRLLADASLFSYCHFRSSQFFLTVTLREPSIFEQKSISGRFIISSSYSGISFIGFSTYLSFIYFSKLFSNLRRFGDLIFLRFLAWTLACGEISPPSKSLLAASGLPARFV